MKRIVDLSLKTWPFPEPNPYIPPPRCTHAERVSRSRTREDIMGFVEMQAIHLGHSSNIMMEFTMTSDPCPGTHLETYYPKKWWYPDIPEKYINVHDLSQLRVSQLAREAAIVELPYEKIGPEIDVSDLQRHGQHIQEGDIVFIKTGYSDSYFGKLPPDKAVYSKAPGLTERAGTWLVKEKKISMYGIDSRSVESQRLQKEKKAQPIHRIFHLNDVYIIEDLAHLTKLNNERVFVIAGVPLGMRYLTGAAVRVIAIEEKNKSRKVVDLSHIIHAYPGAEPEPSSFLKYRVEPIELKSEIRKRMKIKFFETIQFGLDDIVGPQYISCITHLGTHIDSSWLAPLESGIPTELQKDVSRISLERLVGETAVLDLRHIGPRQIINASDLEKAGGNLAEGNIALIRTDFTDWYYHKIDFLDYTPGFSADAIQWLINRKIKALVTDTASIEVQTPSKGILSNKENHWELLKNDIPIIECATNLRMLRKDKVLLACLPLPIQGLDASPAHVVAIEEWE